MNKKTSLLALLGVILLLAACGTAEPSDTAEPAAESTTSQDSGSGMGMGMGNMGGMMARHHAQIPADYAGMRSPVEADEASLARGAEIYTAQCATCHGDGGMGDGPAAAGLDPAPAAIAHTSQMLGDDYLFWRVSEGGGMEPFNSAMVSWKAVLDEDARWDVINYVRAIGSGQVMPMEQMGGAAYSPGSQAAQQEEMLTLGVETGVISEEEAALFAELHDTVESGMHSDSMSGGMDDRMQDSLSQLVADGSISQEQADAFSDIHDRLLEAELMK